MAVIYDEATNAKRKDWISTHLDDYISSGGAHGHIMDLRHNGGPRFVPMLLARYKGRKSGKTMITALGYTVHKGELVIAASKGGADVHPAWYLNIIAGGPIEIQVATQAYNATWRELAGKECEAAWQVLEANNPIYTRYRTSTDRAIPLLAFTPLDEIPVFTRPEA